MMELLVSHLLLSVVCGATGLCAGWWLHCRVPEKRSFVGLNDEGLIRELLSSLHGLSARLAADVDEHHTTVRAVDRELEQVQVRLESSPKVGELVQRLLSANRGVQEKLNETEEKLDDLSYKMEHHASEARTDVLTGLANRRAFQEEAPRSVARFRESDQPFSLVMVDIDRFKQVNDVHGHPFGDEALRGVGEILRDQFRGRDFVTRYGGEEFAIIMPATTVAEARRMAEGVREIIEKTRFICSGKSLNLTVSLGAAEVLPGEKTPELLERADQAMYAAKRAGRNRVYWHDGTLTHPSRSPLNRRVSELDDEAVSAADTCPGSVSTDDAETDTRHIHKGVAAAAAPDERAGNQPSRKLSDGDSEQDRWVHAGNVDVELLNNMGNKTMFCQDLRRRIAEFGRSGARFSTILLRIDDDDQIVGSCDKPTWKLVMSVLAQRVQERMRETDLVARYDDYTFGMVLPDASLKSAVCIGERLRKTVQQTSIQMDGKTLQFTISLGIVEVEEGDEMATFIRRAHEQLEKAQQSGGNRSGFSANALLAS